MRIVSFAVMSLIAVCIAGCTSSSLVPVESSPSSQETAVTTTATGSTAPVDAMINDDLSVSSCNAYIKLMKCVIAKSTGDMVLQQQQNLDTVSNLWRSMNMTQLQQACDSAMNAVTTQKDQMEALGCSIE